MTPLKASGRRFILDFEPLRLSFVGLVLLVTTITLAVLFPPFYFNIGGTDASNYENLSAQFSNDYISGRQFYPPAVAESDFEFLDSVLTDQKKHPRESENVLGMMSPYLYVSSDHRILYPHFHFYSFVLAGFRMFGQDNAAEYLNYGLAFLSAILMFGILKKLLMSWGLSLVGGVLFLLAPATIMGARYPLSESMATFLALLLVYCVMQRRWKYGLALISLILIIAAWTRAEYSVSILMFLIYLGFRFRLRQSYALASLLFLNQVLLTLYYCQANYFHIENGMVRVILWAGLASPLYFGGGYVARTLGLADRIRKYCERFLGNLHRLGLWIPVGFVALVFAFNLFKSNWYQGDITWLKPQRYSIFELFNQGLGTIASVAGMIGLLINSRRWLPKLLPALLFLLPYFLVFIWIPATPSNVWYWTRRMQIIVFPLVIVGFVFLASNLQQRIFGRFRVKGQFVVIVSMAIFVSIFVASNWQTYNQLPQGYLTRENMSAMHQAMGQLPKESVVLLNAQGQVDVIQAPLRSFHGLWSYLIWDRSKLGEVVETFQSAQLSVYLDDTLAQEAINQKIVTNNKIITIPVMISERENFRVILRLVERITK